MKQRLILLSFLLIPLSLFSKSNTEKIGDFFFLAIPAAAYGTTLYLDDKEGQTQFYKSYGTTIGSTLVLKYTIDEERPDGDGQDSFPSGHAASTFSGAAFIHKRYGLEYALVPYLAAIYTAYSRVRSDKHHTHDVIAGAIIGEVSSWYFTSPYKNLDLRPEVSARYQGIRINYRW